MKTQSKEKQSGGFLAKLFGVVTADADPSVVAELAEHLLTTPGESGPAVDESAPKPDGKSSKSGKSSKIDEVHIPGTNIPAGSGDKS